MNTRRTASDRGRRYAAFLVLVPVAALVYAGGAALATCQQVPLAPTGFDPVMACTDEGEQAQGTVAVSLQGDARGSDRPDNPGVAVSGTGNAEGAAVAASVTGRAGPSDPADTDELPGVSVSGTGEAHGLVAVSGTGPARGIVGVSGTGDSDAQVVSVSGTGTAGGQTWTGEHPAPYVAVSACRAEHSDHDDTENGQILTADPTRVHLPVDTGDLLAPDGDHDPTDIEIPLGTTIQSFTCL